MTSEASEERLRVQTILARGEADPLLTHEVRELGAYIARLEAENKALWRAVGGCENAKFILDAYALAQDAQPVAGKEG